MKKRRTKTKIVSHGVGSAFRLAPRSQKSIDNYSFNNPYRFLYVSIVNLYKHQWHVAEAIARLRQKGFPVTVDFVGPAYAPALQRLRNVLREIDPQNKGCCYRGAMPYSELPKYYHRADAFVFASSCENMPNILVEAMASGLPIACSDRGPMPEVLGNAGTYFDPEEPSQIEAALRRLIEDVEMRTQMAWSAFERASTYSWEKCANETFSFLSDIAKEFGGQ